MNTSPKYDIPWELISESLTRNLSGERELQLQQWLELDPMHVEKYKKIQELWKNGVEDYKFYIMANENNAWNALHAQIGKTNPDLKGTKVIQGQFTQNRKNIKYLIAVAAVFLGLVIVGTWFILNKNDLVTYETASNDHKKIILNDGSAISLSPLTKIEVSQDYNKSNRTVIMSSGEAHFDVEHHSDKPFIVNLGISLIKDIGTSFTIQKDKKQIQVKVTSGKVVFIKLTTNETRELPAGTSMTFDIKEEKFSEIKQINLSEEQILNFENTPLSDVIIAIQKVYGKKIILRDELMANKKITAKLEGLPFDSILKIICRSLELECNLNDSVYILKEKE